MKFTSTIVTAAGYLCKFLLLYMAESGPCRVNAGRFEPPFLPTLVDCSRNPMGCPGLVQAITFDELGLRQQGNVPGLGRRVGERQDGRACAHAKQTLKNQRAGEARAISSLTCLQWSSHDLDDLGTTVVIGIPPEYNERYLSVVLYLTLQRKRSHSPPAYGLNY